MDAAHSAHHNKLCEDAVQAFRDAISSLSADYETPCSESDEPQTIRNAYAGLNMDKIITLMGCYNGLASCMKELHRFEQVSMCLERMSTQLTNLQGLYALQEVEELYAIAQRSCRPALHGEAFPRYQSGPSPNLRLMQSGILSRASRNSCA